MDTPIQKYGRGSGSSYHEPRSSSSTTAFNEAPGRPIQPDRPQGVSEFAKFAFIPLKSVNNDGSYELGRIENVATEVTDSIVSILQEIGRRHELGKKRAHPSSQFRSNCCAWLWTIDDTSGVRWTVDMPRKWVCHACFNARRACLLWLGEMRWMVLPLPPQVRDVHSRCEDADFYIYQGSERALSFKGVWQGSRQIKKQKLDERSN